MVLDLSDDILWRALNVIATFAAAISGAVIAYMLHRGERQTKRLDAFDKYRRELLDFTSDVLLAMSAGGSTDKD